MITGSNYTHMPAQSHTHTHTQTSSHTVLYRRKTNTFPTRLLAFSLGLFLFRKEDKYPHNRKSLPPDAFSTVHCFNTCIYLQVWIYSLPAAVRFVLNGKWKDLRRYCGNILTLCLASTPTNELYACELFNKSAEGGGVEVVETGGWGCAASKPQWKEQFINCMRRLYERPPTIRCWGEGIRAEAEILLSRGVRVDTALHDLCKVVLLLLSPNWKCWKYAQPSFEPQLDFMGLLPVWCQSVDIRGHTTELVRW